MKPDTTPAQLRYFLQEELYLLQADKDFYRNPAPAATPATPVAAEAPAVVTETPAPAFKYLGNNQKKLLVICHYTDAEHIADAHLTALTNTLGRLNYALNDIAILNLAHYPAANWAQLAGYFNPQKLLILGNGALPAELAQLTQNQVQQLTNFKVLYTFSFNEMIGQKENTKTFWTQIQTL